MPAFYLKLTKLNRHLKRLLEKEHTKQKHMKSVQHSSIIVEDKKKIKYLQDTRVPSSDAMSILRSKCVSNIEKWYKEFILFLIK